MNTLAATSDESTRLADYIGTVALVILLCAVVAAGAIAFVRMMTRSDVQQHSGSFRHTHTGTFQHNVTGTVRQQVVGDVSVHHTFDPVRVVHELNPADAARLDRLVMQREPLTRAQTVELRRLNMRALTPNHRGELS
jgi:hypothetical protein